MDGRKKDENGTIRLSISYSSVRNGMQSLFWCLLYLQNLRTCVSLKLKQVLYGTNIRTYMLNHLSLKMVQLYMVDTLQSVSTV